MLLELPQRGSTASTIPSNDNLTMRVGMPCCRETDVRHESLSHSRIVVEATLNCTLATPQLQLLLLLLEKDLTNALPLLPCNLPRCA